MPARKIVHVVDDDEAVRDSLGFLLKAASFVVRAYDSPTAFLQALSADVDGCVVTDVRMPGMTGLEMMERLESIGCRLPIIVMTGHGDIPLAVEAMKLGARDFLEKPFADEAILKAVRAALEPAAVQVARDRQADEVAERMAQLTPRERQVLDGVVAGSSNKVIAHELGISPRTIEIYRANVMTKMAADSLSDLVRKTLTAIPARRLTGSS